MNRKPWWRSRTLQINTVVSALVALEAGTGLLQPVLPVNFYTLVAVGLPVVNAVLRVVTTQALTRKGA
jgi:hypothetical protein